MQQQAILTLNLEKRSSFVLIKSFGMETKWWSALSTQTRLGTLETLFLTIQLATIDYSELQMQASKLLSRLKGWPFLNDKNKNNNNIADGKLWCIELKDFEIW